MYITLDTLNYSVELSFNATQVYEIEKKITQITWWVYRKKEKRKHTTALVCPLYSKIKSPDCKSHNLAVLSEDATYLNTFHIHNRYYYITKRQTEKKKKKQQQTRNKVSGIRTESNIPNPTVMSS